MRYLLFGGRGMLGSDMLETLHGEDVIAPDFVEVDITDKEAVQGMIMNFQPDVVINCAAYTDVDGAEKEEEKANEVNGYAVGIMAKICREIDATFVHFSTDYVFDGHKETGYNEEDGTDPLNAYGRSKLLGENLLFDEMDSVDELNPNPGNYFLIRTSWLFGKNGKNFVNTVLDIGRRRKELRVVKDQFGKPTYTLDLCRQVKWLVESREYPSGIYHITNEGETTWYEFARAIFKLAKMDVNVLPCATDEYPRPATRPKYSCLNNNQLPKLRSWKDALMELLPKII